MVSDIYTGPVARALGGADISYLISFSVAGVLYGLLEHSYPALAKSTVLKEMPVV
jgi:hypothetical protein